MVYDKYDVNIRGSWIKYIQKLFVLSLQLFHESKIILNFKNLGDNGILYSNKKDQKE